MAGLPAIVQRIARRRCLLAGRGRNPKPRRGCGGRWCFEACGTNSAVCRRDASRLSSPFGWRLCRNLVLHLVLKHEPRSLASSRAFGWFKPVRVVKANCVRMGLVPVQYRPIMRPSRMICVRVLPLGPEKQRAMPGHDEAMRNHGGGRKRY